MLAKPVTGAIGLSERAGASRRRRRPTEVGAGPVEEVAQPATQVGAPKSVFPTKPGGTGAAYNEATGQGVYVLKNPKTGQIEYVGRGDAPARIAEHAKPGSGKEA